MNNQLLFRKIFIVATTTFLMSISYSEEVPNHINFNEQQEYIVSYNHNTYKGEYLEYQIKDSISNGLNYWLDCSTKPVVLTNESLHFKIVWSDSLSPQEWGAANYIKKDNQIISFTIELNKNKNLTLNEIEMISAHEFGHILEIQHNMSNDSIMNFNAPTMLKQKINKKKDNSLCKHRDSLF